LRNIDQGLTVDDLAGFGVQQDVRSHSLTQQFKGACRTNSRFSRQHNNHIGLLRCIHHKNAASLTRKRQENREQD
jgi:hypothetical protein